MLTRFAAIDTGVKTVSEHNQDVLKAMEEQESGGAQILESVSRLKDITLSVMNGTENMSEAGKRVIKETDEFIAVSDQVVDGMNDIINGAMSHIRIAVDNVNEMSKENNSNFDDLKQEIEKFKVSTGIEKNIILIIDDDETHLAVTKAMLEGDFKVTAVTSGAEALKRFYQGFVPNFILLDLVMPDMDGWSTFDKIKAISNLHHVPIAFFSSSNDPKDIDRARQMGAVDYLKKPIERALLLEKIRRHIKTEQNR